MKKCLEIMVSILLLLSMISLDVYAVGDAEITNIFERKRNTYADEEAYTYVDISEYLTQYGGYPRPEMTIELLQTYETQTSGIVEMLQSRATSVVISASDLSAIQVENLYGTILNNDSRFSYVLGGFSYRIRGTEITIFPEYEVGTSQSNGENAGRTEKSEEIGETESSEESRETSETNEIMPSEEFEETSETEPSEESRETRESEETVEKEDQGIEIIFPAGKSYLYTGGAIKPEVEVYCEKHMLTLNKDYTVKYENNTNAGEARIVVTGKGNYTGKCVESFEIEPVAIDQNKDIAITCLDYVKAPGSNKTAVVFKGMNYGNRKCNVNKDFSLTYQDNSGSSVSLKNISVGDYKMTVQGMGNYSGTVVFDFHIVDPTTICMNTAKVTLTSLTAKNNTVPSVKSISIGGKTYTRNGKNLIDDVFDITIPTNPLQVGKQAILIKAKDPTQYIGIQKAIYTVPATKIDKKLIYVDTQTKYPFVQQDMDGRGIMPRMETTLVEGKDYTVSCINNRKAGTATITFKGIDQYTGTLRYTYRITKAELQDGWIQGSDAVSHSKAGAKPKLHVKNGNYELVEGIDYTVRATNNKSVGTGICQITGKGNYSGVIKDIPFVIEEASLDAENQSIVYTVEDILYQPKKENYKIKVTLKDHNKKMVEGKDYEIVAQSDMIQVTAAEMNQVAEYKEVPLMIKGIGDYTGTKEIIGTIYRKKASALKVVVPDQTYDKGTERVFTEKDIEVWDGNKQVTDFVILKSSYKNHILAGKNATFVISAKGYGGTKTVKFRIKPRDISKNQK